MVRVLKIIMSWLLILAIPLSVLGLTANLVVRMPDLYQYEMNSSQILKPFGATGQEESVAESIAKYMQHRADEFQYQYDEEDEMSLLFTKDEQNSMVRLRTGADITAAVTIVSLVILIVSYIVLVRGEHYELLRFRMLISVVIYILCLGTAALFFFMPALKPILGGAFFTGLEEPQLLFSIFTGTYAAHFFYASMVISLILMGLLFYFVWTHTRPKNIFGKRY